MAEGGRPAFPSVHRPLHVVRRRTKEPAVPNLIEGFGECLDRAGVDYSRPFGIQDERHLNGCTHLELPADASFAWLDDSFGPA